MTKKRRPAAKKSKPDYLNASLSADERVRDLLQRMTLEEKVRQMGQFGIKQLLTKNGRVSAKIVRKLFGGMSIGCLEDPRLDPKRSAEAVNQVQKYLAKNTRLGIPGLVISECIHGHMSGGTTMFPQAIGLASTWNPGLVTAMSRAAAREARAVGVAQALSPDLDLAREPRWGRVEETYGEDPWLASRMSVAFVKGMQGERLTIDREHLICTAKHYAAHGSPESGLNLSPVAGGERELRSLYLIPFEAAVKEAGILSVMPAYSEYDGVPASSSKLLLTQVLRKEWGFRGYTYSDYSGIQLLHTFHKTAHSPAEAGKQALEAGMDLEAPGDYGYGECLLDLVRKGEVATELVDQACTRILRVKFLAGLFENPYADVRSTARIVHCAAHRKLAREIAQESIILLKNEKNLLPLDGNIGSIAVIGPNADVVQYGDYSTGKAGDVTPLQGIRKAVSKGTKVLCASGCGVYGTSREEFKKAVDAAERSEVAVVVIGGISQMMGGVGWGKDDAATCGESHDLHDLNPPGLQSELVRAVHDTGTPVVVVLVHGRPYSIEWMAENIPAIIEAWYPGEQGGHALADVLFGKVNPSGKLPLTVPRSAGHVPVFYNHKPSARGYYHDPGTPEQPGRDYVFSRSAPLFKFGHGLSYTRFSYTNLKVPSRKILPAGRVEVSVDVRNTGKIAGKEVVQLYINDVVSSVTTPVKVLRRFEKTALKPGEKKTVRFVLSPDDLALLDENMNRIVEPGIFEVMIGGLKKTFEVVLPE